MTTEALITQLLDAPGMPSEATIKVLHRLLDDSTIESSAPPLNVREAADLVKLSPHTLRYYESEGLIRPARDASGYREYGAGDLRRLIFLTRMRVSGMTMRDLKRYILLVDQGDVTLAERRQIMLDQRERIIRQLRELTLALEATEYKIHTYNGHPEPESRR